MDANQWQEIGKNLGIISGAILAVGAVIKYLVADWFEKNKELANVKQNQADKLISKLEGKVEELEKKIQDHAQKIVLHTERLKQTEHIVQQVLNRVDEYAANTRETVNKLAELSHKRFNRIEETNPIKKTKSVTEKFGKDSIIVRSVPDDEGDE